MHCGRTGFLSVGEGEHISHFSRTLLPELNKALSESARFLPPFPIYSRQSATFTHGPPSFVKN